MVQKIAIFAISKAIREQRSLLKTLFSIVDLAWMGQYLIYVEVKSGTVRRLSWPKESFGPYRETLSHFSIRDGPEMV